jgi:hypothetical protein
METTENNKLIAEFMGMNYGDLNDNSVMTQMTPQGNEVVPIDSMKYHNSWDWLMPVVREVVTLIDINKLDFDSSALKHEVLDNDIKQVHIEVVEFIKEYNKQN